jgi:putative ABC transport system permease protein
VIQLETLRIALGGLRANKLRSSLTILGLTIGVASVIILIAVGNGSAQTVQRRIEALGSNVLLITRGFTLGGSASSNAPIMPLTQQDVDALNNRSAAPDVASASPVVNAANTTLVANGVSYSPSSFVGTTPSYLTAHSYQVAAGANLTAADVTKRRRVMVIGPTVVTNLFAGQDPVGQTIQAGGSQYQVVGVTVGKGSNGIQDQDDVAFAPISAVQDTLTGYGNLDSITVQARSRGQLDAAQAEVTAVLDQRHHISAAASPDFRVINQGSILAASSSTSSVFTTLLGEVAAISLLVGGIGVMNIMLVSVTERTREIGIRKAIGARRGDILAQFLAEAVLVSVLGGVFGVAVGVIGSQFTIAGVQPVIATYSIFLALGAAVATGLFFGTYPAGRAAGLRPIEALRYE